jgi:hypothetical protein
MGSCTIQYSQLNEVQGDIAQCSELNEGQGDPAHYIAN